MFKPWGTVAASVARRESKGREKDWTLRFSTLSDTAEISGVDQSWRQEELHVLANSRVNAILQNRLEDN